MKNTLLSETCEYEVPTNFGPDYSPKTPEVVSQRNFLPECKTNEPEQVLKNMIPCGINVIPRTPFHDGAALDKKETNEPQKSPQNSSQENKIKTNFIPCGMNIPRTPFNGKSVENAGKSELFLQLRKVLPNSRRKIILMRN